MVKFLMTSNHHHHHFTILYGVHSSISSLEHFGRWPRTCIMELLILLNLVWKIQYLNVALSVIPDSAAQQMSTANHHGGSFGNLP